MRVLFFTPGNIAFPMQEFELEFIQNHLAAGDEVTVLQCHGDLPSCWVNPEHKWMQCLYCKSKLNRGYNMLDGKIKLENFYHLSPEDLQEINNFKVEVSDADNLKKVYVGSFDLGWSILSTLISKTRDPYPDLIAHTDWIQVQAKKALILYKSMKRYLGLHTFDKAYLYNGRITDQRPVMRAIQEFEKIKLYTYNAGGVNNTYGLFEDTFVHDIRSTEKMIQRIWDANPNEEEKIRIASEFYENRMKGKVTIGKAYMANQQIGLLPENFDESKKNISIFISSEDENLAIGDYWDFPFYTDQLDGLKQLISNFNLFDKDVYHFYIRLHPHLAEVENDYKDEMLNLRHPMMTMIPPESPISTYRLVQVSDKILTFCSTVGAEATYLGIPAIEAGKSFYYNLDATYNPHSHEELLDLLRTVNLPAKNKMGILKYAYWWVRYGETAKYVSFESSSEGKYKGKKIQANILLESLKKISKLRN